MNLNLKYEVKAFQELSLEELYQILRLRQEVFVVEQNCPYLDNDNNDQAALHLLLWCDHDLAAYARLLPKGVAYPKYSSIGRVVSSPKYRRMGVGRKLMEKAIQEIQKRWVNDHIKISAQVYLIDFYESYGFCAIGDIYLEDNIEHISMIMNCK